MLSVKISKSNNKFDETQCKNIGKNKIALVKSYLENVITIAYDICCGES